MQKQIDQIIDLRLNEIFGLIDENGNTKPLLFCEYTERKKYINDIKTIEDKTASILSILDASPEELDKLNNELKLNASKDKIDSFKRILNDSSHDLIQNHKSEHASSEKKLKQTEKEQKQRELICVAGWNIDKLLNIFNKHITRILSNKELDISKVLLLILKYKNNIKKQYCASLTGIKYINFHRKHSDMFSSGSPYFPIFKTVYSLQDKKNIELAIKELESILGKSNELGNLKKIIFEGRNGIDILKLCATIKRVFCRIKEQLDNSSESQEINPIQNLLQKEDIYCALNALSETLFLAEKMQAVTSLLLFRVIIACEHELCSLEAKRDVTLTIPGYNKLKETNITLFIDAISSNFLIESPTVPAVTYSEFKQKIIKNMGISVPIKSKNSVINETIEDILLGFEKSIATSFAKHIKIDTDSEDIRCNLFLANLHEGIFQPITTANNISNISMTSFFTNSTWENIPFSFYMTDCSNALNMICNEIMAKSLKRNLFIRKRISNNELFFEFFILLSYSGEKLGILKVELKNNSAQKLARDIILPFCKSFNQTMTTITQKCYMLSAFLYFRKQVEQVDLITEIKK